MADKFQLKAILSAVDKITPVLKGVQRTTRVVHKALRDVGNAGGELMAKIGLPVGVALGAITYAVRNATRAVLDYGGAIADASDRTGVAVDTLQAFRLAGEQAGVAATMTDDSLMKLNKALSDAASGKNQKIGELLERLHVPKGMTDINKALPIIADGFARNTDVALRTRMAMALFSESGAKLVPVLSGGSKGLAALTAETVRLGAALNERSVGVLDEFGDQLGLIGRQVLVQFGESLAQVLPMISPMLTRLSEWISANKELIQQGVARVVGQIAAAIARIDWAQVVSDLRDVMRGIRDVVRWMGGLKGLAIGLGVVFLAGPVAALFSLAGAFGRLAIVAVGALRAIGVALLMNPVLFALTALVLSLAAAAWYVWKKWTPIKAFFVGLWASITESFTSAWTAIGTVFESIKTGITQGFWEIISVALTVVRRLASIVPNMLGGDRLRAQLDGALAAADEGAGRSPGGGLLAQTGRQRLDGALTVRFENAPAGMRVDPGRTSQPGVALNPDVGYRSQALGVS